MLPMLSMPDNDMLPEVPHDGPMADLVWSFSPHLFLYRESHLSAGRIPMQKKKISRFHLGSELSFLSHCRASV
ncbi:unnamed protein product [Mycena citricolor]|uniref:Uncharacterized protein n=1 Tax=Mycena citricolor TaxID=2018698 RepID=A0AAD2HUI5_9AGAR|nr:unnamed protein product [Mycena citricolor]